MRIRYVSTLFAAALIAFSFAPSAIAADVTDVGLLDQAELANLPVFVSANQQLAVFKSQLDGQFNNQMKGARTDADKQRISIALPAAVSRTSSARSSGRSSRARNSRSPRSARRTICRSSSTSAS